MAHTCPYPRPAAKIWKELQEAEPSDAVESATGTMQTLLSSDTNPKSKLGLTVHAPLKVNGITATALINKGSPATIVSLEFVIRVLVEKIETPQQ